MCRPSGETAVRWTNIVVWSQLPDALLPRTAGPFENKFADHADETRMRADGSGSDHVQAGFGAGLFRLRIEVEQHFHMVRDETDWRDNDVGDST